MTCLSELTPDAWGFSKGDLVEIRSAPEILATLASDGTLEKLPCMPEMLKWCGKQFRVASRAHKLCDTIEKSGARYMKDAVHLGGVRCDGAAHGGCEAGCLVVWKEAWLRPVDPHRQATRSAPSRGLCTAETLQSFAESEPKRYRCQATELRRATQPRKFWNPRFYWEDWRSGNVPFKDMLVVLFLRALYVSLQRIGRPFRLTIWIYNGIAHLKGLPSFPYLMGTIKGKTPHAELGLQPGEMVRIKSQEEILKTLAGWKNRGMRFDPEMVTWCGREFRVQKRLQRIIDEKTGEMVELGNDCILLDGPYCMSFHSDRRLFCSRAITPYWREIWLERIEHEPSAQQCSSTCPAGDSAYCS